MDSYCHICGNKGKEGGCPACGRKLAGLDLGRLTLGTPAEIIPVAYRGKCWVSPDSGGDRKLEEHYRKWNILLETFQRGELPKFSAFLGMPAKSNKHLFAYSCMQAAIMSGYSVAPFFNTSDWRRLYKTSQVNPLYKMYGEYRWDQMVKQDIVFLFVDHSDERFTSLSLFKDILDIRSGFNLPTFIISDFELGTLVPKWNSKEYYLIYNPDPACDRLRYPVVLQYFSKEE